MIDTRSLSFEMDSGPPFWRPQDAPGARYDGEIGGLSAGPVRAYLAEIAGLAPATRKRKRAAVASFCRWAVRHDLLTANPMDKIDAIKVPRALPRPAPAAYIAKVLGSICG